jgi:hypothetical protein
MAQHTDAMRQFIVLSESIDNQPLAEIPSVDADLDLHESTDTQVQRTPGRSSNGTFQTAKPPY